MASAPASVADLAASPAADADLVAPPDADADADLASPPDASPTTRDPDVRPAPLDLPNYNNTNYPLAVQNQLTALDYEASGVANSTDSGLRYHQFITKEFFSRNPHARGILIAHAQGTGKTRLAVAIADYYNRFDRKRKINVLMPKALEANFRATIESFGDRTPEFIDKNYSFVSLNASNMLTQMKNSNLTKEQRKFEKKIGMFMQRIGNSLDHTLLIIDEAHNLFNSITNGSKNALGLYDMIIQAKNLRLIFLTGTPIVNDPFELVPCFNMLRGTMRTDLQGVTKLDDGDGTHSRKRRGFGNQKRDERSSLLFGESTDEFTEYFVDRKANKIKNRDKFINRIYGLTSYVGSVYLSPGVTREGFPKELPTIEVRVPMSAIQYAPYAAARESEMKDEGQKGYRQEDARFSASAGGSSTYRVKSRQLSNYFIPDYARGPPRGRKARLKFIDKIRDEDLLNPAYSPKMAAILANLAKPVGTSGDEFNHAMVYSNYVSGEGLAVFARILLLHGWTLYDSKSHATTGGWQFGRTVTGGWSSSTMTPRYSGGVNMHNSSAGPRAAQFGVTSQHYGGAHGRCCDGGRRQHAQHGGSQPYGNIGANNSADGRFSGAGAGPSGPSDASPPGTFMLLSGSVPPDDRALVIAAFNSAANRDGSIIRLLLLSSALAEGIDLKRVKQVHIMEPFWNYARIGQIKARAIRYNSHADLPESDRQVQVYIYLSDYPSDVAPEDREAHGTTDVSMYERAVSNMALIDTFMHAVAESSIDCGINYPDLPADVKKNIACKLCAPNNQQLFHPLIAKDMSLPSSCAPYSESKVEAHEIYLPDSDEKFYYSLPGGDEPLLYVFNSKLNGYVPMSRGHPYFGRLMTLIDEHEGDGAIKPPASSEFGTPALQQRAASR